jgi:hypothetical protein
LSGQDRLRGHHSPQPDHRRASETSGVGARPDSLRSALCCLLSALDSLLSAVCGLRSAVCCLLFAVYCLSSAVCCLLSTLCILLSAIRSLLYAVYCMLSAFQTLFPALGCRLSDLRCSIAPYMLPAICSLPSSTHPTLSQTPSLCARRHKQTHTGGMIEKPMTFGPNTPLSVLESTMRCVCDVCVWCAYMCMCAYVCECMYACVSVSVCVWLCVPVCGL